MNDGEIIEQGPYPILIKRNGPLQELLATPKLFGIDDEEPEEVNHFKFKKKKNKQK